MCTQKKTTQVPNKAFLTANVSSILTSSMLTKQKDPGCPTISCVIGNFVIDNALLDLGVSINLIPYTIYKQLGLGELKPTSVTIQLVDRSIKNSMGIVEDALVKVGGFIYPVDFIIRETQRCKGIIQDLLEFSRDKEPKKVLANMNDIIEKALSILENEFHLHHTKVQKNLSSKMPESMLDVSQMQQVFTNLLINAVEAIQEDGVIKIKSHMTPDKKTAIIEIEDSGCGIPSDQMEKIFEPFFSTKQNGTGLGLAVRKSTVIECRMGLYSHTAPGPL